MEERSTIAQAHDLYMDEVRNPQLAECAEKIEKICRHYAIYDNEFDNLIEMVKDSLFTFTEFISDDDEDEELF